MRTLQEISYVQVFGWRGCRSADLLFFLGIKLPVIPKCQQRRYILGEKNFNLRTWKCPWKEIRSEFERFWISLELEERKTEKSCAVSPEEFHAREYLRLLRATVPYSNRRDKKKRNACNELCGIGIDVPLEFATKSRLPELAEILLRKLRDARTISSKDSLELQQWMECSAVCTLVERYVAVF
ncbi:hypothetical protein TNCT_224411 [Trichonephila clavata]|uniref:Uncharacterized protein n=1 Tax=Trichonephila clavata TaxID=2740835 RepID=A0A8X6F1V2_TRICU|nr:hypothetical protein TNCT_224411 [Trichonephila clavata]